MNHAPDPGGDVAQVRQRGGKMSNLDVRVRAFPAADAIEEILLQSRNVFGRGRVGELLLGGEADASTMNLAAAVALLVILKRSMLLLKISGEIQCGNLKRFLDQQMNVHLVRAYS